MRTRLDSKRKPMTLESVARSVDPDEQAVGRRLERQRAGGRSILLEAARTTRHGLGSDMRAALAR